MAHTAIGHPEWSYDHPTGPAAWAELGPSYATCGAGTEQSPIDLHAAEHAEHANLELSYAPAALSIVHNEHVSDIIDNGHTIQVNYGAVSRLALEGRDFGLAQFHFHSPSEHTVDGREFPMEMHLVHQSTDGELAVVGVLIREGGHNSAFDDIWTHMPTRKGESVHREHVTVDVDDLLPADRSTFRYRGSLTTPPCSEGVRWFVVCEPIEMSTAQIARFSEIVGKNNRPVQSVGARVVTVDRFRIDESR